MNERIKLLWDQAEKEIKAEYEDESRRNRRLYNEIFLPKFAELIVRECALVAKTLPHTPERHWVQDSVTYIPVHCEQNILKHFGIDE